jgi:hypothetical protein
MRLFIDTGLEDWAIPGLEEKEETKEQLNKENDIEEG